MNKTKLKTSLDSSLYGLCTAGTKTQSQEHIKPLHRYCANRLVLEGGFPPEWISPRPQFSSTKINNAEYELNLEVLDEAQSEARVLGGIKYKDVDVTVIVPGIGPALAISAKSTGNAFRNLNNRMEEALGECVNVHLMYPGLVFGFLHLIRFATVATTGRADASFSDQGKPLPSILRYYEVLRSLSGRTLITDPGMRYESVSLAMYDCSHKGTIREGFPATDSPIHLSRFFTLLYQLYDLRFGYPDPKGPNIRKEWKPQQGVPVGLQDSDTTFAWEVRTHSDQEAEE